MSHVLRLLEWSSSGRKKELPKSGGPFICQQEKLQVNGETCYCYFTCIVLHTSRKELYSVLDSKTRHFLPACPDIIYCRLLISYLPAAQFTKCALEKSINLYFNLLPLDKTQKATLISRKKGGDFKFHTHNWSLEGITQCHSKKMGSQSHSTCYASINLPMTIFLFVIR